MTVNILQNTIVKNILTDLTYLLSELNHAANIYHNADIDGNGIVNATDLTYLLAGFNKQNVIIIND